MAAVAALIIITWMLTLASACLITYGMISKVEDMKLLLYRIALILMSISGLYVSSIVTFFIVITCLCLSLYWSSSFILRLTDSLPEGTDSSSRTMQFIPEATSSKVNAPEVYFIAASGCLIISLNRFNQFMR